MALTKFNFNSFDLTTAASTGLAFNSDADGFETSSSGSMTLIKTLTASSSATLSFLNGSDSVVFDNTYPVYLFKYIGIHPETNAASFTFQVDTGTNTSYNITVTSTAFLCQHDEGDSATSLAYNGAKDQAQGTSFHTLLNEVGNGGDECGSGDLYTAGNVGIGTTDPISKLDVNGDSIRIRTSNTPATAGALGSPGEIRWDANYIYICIGVDTWRRIAHSTW